MSKKHYKTVLLVEDNDDLRLLYEKVIRQFGMLVFSATDAEEALKKLDVLNDTHKPCLVLTDLCMPGMSGFDLAKKISAEATLATIPIVVMTALNGVKNDELKVIKKPVSIATLTAILEQHCGPLLQDNDDA